MSTKNKKQRNSLNQQQLSRREFLKASAAMGLSLGTLSSLLAACSPATEEAVATAVPAVVSAVPSSNGVTEVTWISPRGTLEVMDDFNLWVAKKMGYFEELGLEVTLEPGPSESLAVTRLVAEEQADVGFPSPGVLLSSIDAGMPVIMAWEMMLEQVFDFAVRPDSGITTVQDLEGKTIAVWAAGADVVANPILVEAGLDPSTVTYLPAGGQTAQAVVTGEADAALSWRGLAAQWLAQGMDLEFLVGKTFSNHPANGYAIRADEVDDPEWSDIWERFFKANAMAFEFSRANPQAALQMTYEEFPALAEQMTPQLALNSMLELGTGYFEGDRRGQGYGWSDIESWQSYIDTVFELGQIDTHLDANNVVTNEFIAEANNFDKEAVRQDAANFEVDSEYRDLEILYDL
jgi:NitT/TauT family transport system substrate-binding protein